MVGLFMVILMPFKAKAGFGISPPKREVLNLRNSNQVEQQFTLVRRDASKVEYVKIEVACWD